MANSWRISVFIGLAIQGGGTTVIAQIQPMFANRQAAMSSARRQPRAATPPQVVQSLRKYFPGLRVSQYRNGNVAPVRRSRRGMGTGGGSGIGMGIGRGMSARPSTPSRGTVPAGRGGRGR